MLQCPWFKKSPWLDSSHVTLNTGVHHLVLVPPSITSNALSTAPGSLAIDPHANPPTMQVLTTAEHHELLEKLPTMLTAVASQLIVRSVDHDSDNIKGGRWDQLHHETWSYHRRGETNMSPLHRVTTTTNLSP